VQLTSGTRTLHTAGAQVVTVGNTVIENLLQTLVNPNLLFMLLSLGIWAILIELSSPGGWVAGFIGTVCVLLAIYGMGILSVNWFGGIFLLVAFALFALEIKTPAHGLMILAGLGSFIVGALVLFNSVRLPGQPRLSIPLVVGTALFIALTFLGVLRLVLRAQRAPVLTGRETLVGSTGFARSELNPEGVVYVNGEMWRAMTAEGEPPMPKDTKVEVVGVEGLQIKVRRANDPEKSG
jgi:membrane-bound serine protease (ClpP class)